MSIERSPSGPRLLATKITGSRGAQVPKMEVQASLHWEEWRVGQYEVNLQYTHGVIWNRSLTQSHSIKCAHMHLPEYHSCFRMFALPSSFFLSFFLSFYMPYHCGSSHEVMAPPNTSGQKYENICTVAPSTFLCLYNM